MQKKKNPYCNAFLHSLQCESHHHLPESYCMRALGRFVVVFSSLRFAEDFALGLKSSSSSSIIMATLLCGEDKRICMDLLQFFSLYFTFSVPDAFFFVWLTFGEKYPLMSYGREHHVIKRKCFFVGYRPVGGCCSFLMPRLANVKKKTHLPLSRFHVGLFRRANR